MKTFDTLWLSNVISTSVDTVLYQRYQRLSSHIFTDKVVYRPNDTMFIEVLVLDTFNKTPVALTPKDQYLYNYYLTMEIDDASGQKFYSTSTYIINSTATFTYKVPKDISGGEYYIKLSSYYIAPAKKLIRIRDYARD